MTDSAQLHLPAYRLSLHLGVGERERAAPQEVVIEVCLDFSEPPGACVSDDVTETLNYSALAKGLDQTFTGSTYRTIEHLTLDLLNYLCEHFPVRGRIALTTHKFPATRGLEGGARFQLVRQL